MEELRGSIDAEAHRVGQLRERLEREGVDIGIAELKQIWEGRLRAFWRLYPELYSTLAGQMVKRSENFAAIEICAEGLSFFPRHGDLVLYLALSLARTGSPNRAFELLNSAGGWLDEHSRCLDSAGPNLQGPLEADRIFPGSRAIVARV